MSKFPLFCFTFLLLMASSVLSQDVHCSFDNKVNFSKFKTYKWVTFKNSAPIDRLTDEQIKAAFDAVLARRGLMRLSGDSTADLFIGYQTTELITEESSPFSTWDASPPTIYKGDLAIDMYTPANHDLVWRGVASKTLDPKAKPEKIQKNLNKAVTKIMKNYPPSNETGCVIDSMTMSAPTPQ